MADRIKGITVEIGGDTQGLDKALKGVNNTSRNLQTELRQVERLLKFNPESVELMEQRQKLLADSVENTSKKLNQLKEVQSQVEAQFEKGEIGAEQFRRFQREIVATEGRLQHLQGELQKTEKTGKEAAKNISDDFANMAAGIGAGIGAAGAVQKALESTTLDTTIDVAFNVPEESEAAVKDAINSVSAYGIDAAEALEGVRRQWALNSELGDEANAKLVKQAGLIASAYQGIDFQQLIQETSEMSTALGISAEEAMGMTESLLNMGFPPEQIDIISEYGTQLQRAGYSGQEIANIFAAGVQTDSWNIDVLLDGLKEGRIRLAEFGTGIDKATGTMIAKTDISKSQLQEWGKAVAEGGEKGKTAMDEAAKAVMGIEDATLRNQIGVKLFGTLWEENGEAIGQTILGAKDETINLGTATDQLNTKVGEMDASPQVQLNNALKDMNTALQPLLEIIANFVGHVSRWASENPKLASTVTAIIVALGIFLGLLVAILPALGGMTLAFGAITAPIGLAIAAIAAIIAIIVAAIINFDAIKKKAGELSKEFRTKFEEMRKSVSEKLNEITEKCTELKGKIIKAFKGINLRSIGKDIISGLIGGISSMADSLYKKASELASGISKKIRGALKMRSPSKVTEEDGQDAGQGLVEGLKNSISRVSAMSNKLAQAAVPNIKQQNSQQINSSRGGGDVYLTVNAPQQLSAYEVAKHTKRMMNTIATQI